MTLVYACLDATAPTAESPCVETAWIELPTAPLPTLTPAEASEIGIALLWLAGGMAALKLIGRAT